MDWYEEDVLLAEKERDSCTYKPETIFYGSSTFRLWSNLYNDFKKYKPINLGFGGSTLAACAWFFNRLIGPVKDAKRFLLYAGDNDLGDGRRPEELLLFFREFMISLRSAYPHIPFYFISIKPSVIRQEIMEEIIAGNSLIESEISRLGSNNHYVNIFSHMIDPNGNPKPELFEEDGLHLNQAGYQLWKQVLLKECFTQP